MKTYKRTVVVFAALAIAVWTQPASAQGAAKKTVTVKGSDTMVQMSANLAEAFMAKNPAVSMSVTGGGSGGGISALLSGTTDICNSSRDVKPEEKQKGIDNGVAFNEINVALDGIAIVVNKDSALNEISLEQLMKIYTGQVSDWTDVGAGAGKIIVLSRETSSGTYVFFQEHVLQKKDYAAGVRMMPATSAIIESVASDKLAIGYVGLGYAIGAKDRVKILPVKKDAESPAIEATEETVRSKTYPISRFLHCYTNGKPAGNVKQFIDFTLSPEGQNIVREEGYVPLN